MLHWGSLVWALGAIAALVAATELGLLDYRPGGDAYEITQQQVFGVVFAVSAALAWKWKIVGGLIAAFAAGALIVFAARQLEVIDATVVAVAFIVPGALWIVLALCDRSTKAAAAVLALTATALVAGGLVADSAYQELFGPFHPSSTTEAPSTDAVDWIWSGAVTTDSAVVSAKLSDDAGEARVAISESASLARPRYGSRVPVGDDRTVRMPVDGLQSDTTYHYALEVDGELKVSDTGVFRTFPDGAASFTLAVGACARVGSNGAVFDRIREADPLLYVLAGDFHYANIGDDDRKAYQELYDFTLAQPGQAALYRSTPVSYVWDDHDFGADGSDGTSPSRPAAMGAYRDNVPHYPLAGPDAAIYQAFTVGRMRVIITDTRSARSPSSDRDDANKTMLGVEQKDWFKRELLAANSARQLILWVNSVPWIAKPAAGGDDWGGYTVEREELANFIADNEIVGLLMASGDAHMLAIDDGSNSDYSRSGRASFPILHAGALDRPGSVKGGPFSEGTFPGAGQFGLISVNDEGGDEITVGFTGHNWEGDTQLEHRFTVPVGPG